MKFKTLLFVAAVFVSGNVHATWEQPRNPDRFMSVAVLIENYRASGYQTDFTAPNANFSLREEGRAAENSNNLGVNFRAPLSDCLTMDVNYINIDGEQTYDRASGIYHERNQLKGYRANIGFRLYFNR